MNAQTTLVVALTLLSTAAQAETPDANQADQTTIKAQLNHADGVYRDGDRLRVWLEVNAPMHVYVVYHQEDGQAVMLFPNPGRQDSRLCRPGRHELPSVKDEVQCVIRGDFESEAVQVLASPRPIAAFEEALSSSEGSVPVISTNRVNDVCNSHAETDGLASTLLRVTLGSDE